ncbi:MAG: peptidyl-prolyl cis-trans isomerase [bacterium]|nr:peptidyl-prolyl cis-trans isomerase [bacterium]
MANDSRSDPAPDEKVTPSSPGRPGEAVRVRVETSAGDIVVELHAREAPLTVANFLAYVGQKFYNGTVFHRVVPHFLIQGGGYTAALVPKTGGLLPPIRNEWNNGLKNEKYTVGAARVPGKPHSATAQFYINVQDNPRLDLAQEDGAGYAVFGRVVEGQDVVEKIRQVQLRDNPRYRDPSGDAVVPVRMIVIRSVDLIDASIALPPPASEEQDRATDDADAGAVAPGE